ncbi:hypothetical protein AN619_10820 [Thermotalea metallivorans]|uniref:DUF1576 domain-containing protein n=1 Tax=Thermotalea metallivorans TaxID=520762 RepID=A0A140L6F0_9FIRM|nr:hypothetical protein AN619_10820 [Thermotalea metallivorans]
MLALYGVLFILFGFLMDSPQRIFQGLRQIIVEPDFLITDYIGVGGLGATFVNAGLLTLMAVLLLYKLDIKVTGATISTVWIMAGFGLFGKNIFNIWFIMVGVWLYAKFQKDKFIKYVYIGLFGTSLAPMVTQIMFITNLSKWLSIPLGVVTGILIGFILPPLSAYLMRVHQGFNLYNIGFTAGIIGTIFVSVLKSYGLVLDTRMIWTTGNNWILGSFLCVLFFLMIGIGLYFNKASFKNYQKFFKYSGRLITDFVILEGFAPSLLNMGINGLMSTFYVLLIRGDLNGPTIGGIFTIVGFSAFGKHLGNMLPIFIGVFLGGLTKIWNVNDPAIVLAALFGTTLAPIAGEFGWKFGVLAGFLHSSVVLNVGFLHGGVNLYNNGFSGGIVAATLIPIIEAFKKEV